ncbi:MAG: DUF882 domain-containing protein [Polyangiaceae bacterium]
MFGREQLMIAWAAPLCVAWMFPGAPPASTGMTAPVVQSVARSLRHWNVPVTISRFEERGSGAIPWVSKLTPIRIKNLNTNAEAELTLYTHDGSVDKTALAEFNDVVARDGRLKTIAPRTVQLAMKAAWHFHVGEIRVISAYRPATRHDHGPHTTGSAVDFQLPGVAARTLAAYLRKEPRAGVGIYTNPRTQFVHIDSREQSYHWLDASPPGIVWREKGLADPTREARDASYTADHDLPE